VEAKETVDGRLVLRFQDGAFKDPFIARYVSDGTIKMFAYLVLLHDPSPHPCGPGCSWSTVCGAASSLNPPWLCETASSTTGQS